MDVKILRQLTQGEGDSPLTSDPKKSISLVAKKLSVDQVTVRRRIGRLRKTGVLGDWKLVMSPNLLGVKYVTLLFDTPVSSMGDQIRRLKLIDGVITIIRSYSGLVAVILYYEEEDSLRKRVELIQRMLNAENLIRTDLPFPPCSISLTKSDWNIFRSFQKNPSKPLRAVSTELGLSSRTVKRRLMRMIDGKAIFAIPSLNPKALEGAILADLLIFYQDSASKLVVDQEIISQLDESLVRAELGDPEHGLFNLIIRNISKAQEILDWVKKQPGISRARIDLVHDRVEVYESLSALVERRFSQNQTPPLKKPVIMG